MTFVIFYKKYKDLFWFSCYSEGMRKRTLTLTKILKMKKLIILIALVFVEVVHSQNVIWEYVNNNNLTLGKSIAINSQNEIISVGNCLLVSACNEFIYTQKLSSQGDLIWEDSVSTNLPNNYHSTTWVGTDSEDNIIVVGYRYTLSGSNEVPNAIKVLKYSNTGNLIYNITLDGVFGSGANTNLGYKNKAEIDENNNLYIGAVGTTDINEPSGFLLLKFDTDGNLLWERRKVFTSIHGIRNMNYDNGKIALTGVTTFSELNNAIAVWDASGTELWSINNGNTDQTWATDIVLDDSGNAYSLTQISGTTNLGIALVKYNSIGTVLFTATYFLDVDATSGRLKFLPNGNLVITGTNWTISGLGKLYVAEVSTVDGSVVSESTHSLNQNNNWVYNVDVAQSGNYYVSGRSDNNGGAPAEMFLLAFSSINGFEWSTNYSAEGVLPIDFSLDADEQLYAVINNKYAVVKFGNTLSNLSVDEFSNDNIKIYPNPVTDRLYFSNNELIKNISIFDLNGKQVLNKNIDFQYVDISTLKSGVYLVKIFLNNSSTYISKIIVN